MSNIPTQRSIDLNTGYCLYYVLLFSTLVLLAYLSISVLISSIVYWLVHYILKASNSKILFIYGLSYGDSMSPALPDGLKLILLVYPFNLTKGDVVVYNTTGRFIKHRIIDVEETSSSTLYYVKGDNDQAVEKIQKKHIQAKQIQICSKLLYVPLSPRALADVLG